MTNPYREAPDPLAIEMEAQGLPPKMNLRDYGGAMREMRNKGYSYGEIAEWLGERLGLEVRRGQVYWILNGPPAGPEEDDDRAAEKEAEEV